MALPLARRGVVVSAILVWTRAFGIFGPLMVFVGAVRFRTEVLPTTVYLEQSVGRIEVALAVAILMLLLATTLVGASLSGCGDTEPEDAPTLTYYGEAKSIIDARCATCHRAGEIGPFPLTTYEEVSTYAAPVRASKRRVQWAVANRVEVSAMRSKPCVSGRAGCSDAR